MQKDAGKDNDRTPPVPPDERPVRPVQEPPPGRSRDVPEPPVENPDADPPEKISG